MVEVQPHMLALPKAFIGLRIVQLVFAVIIFGISIYGSLAGTIPGPALNLFTSLVTIITIVYFLVARYAQPVIYQYWAILGLDIFCMIFWLVAFAVLASEVALAASVTCKSYSYDGYVYSTDCSSGVLGVLGLFGACAGLGAVEFVLFIATTALISTGLTRHRSAGGHSAPGSAAAAAAGGAPQKYEMSGQSTGYPTAPAPAGQGVPYQTNPAPAPQAHYQTNAAPVAQSPPYQPYAQPYAQSPLPTPMSSPSPVSAQPVASYSQTQDPRYGGGPPVHNAQQYQQPAPQFAPEQNSHFSHPTVTEMPSMPHEDYPQQYKQPEATQLP